MAVTAASGDIPRTSPRPAAALIVSWSSLALYGNLALWWLLAGRLLRAGSSVPAHGAVACPEERGRMCRDG